MLLSQRRRRLHRTQVKRRSWQGSGQGRNNRQTLGKPSTRQLSLLWPSGQEQDLRPRTEIPNQF